MMALMAENGHFPDYLHCFDLSCLILVHEELHLSCSLCERCDVVYVPIILDHSRHDEDFIHDSWPKDLDLKTLSQNLPSEVVRLSPVFHT